MKKETYDYLCDNALEQAIQDVLNSIPEKVRQKYSLSYDNNLEHKKALIFKEYDQQRKLVRDKFFDTGMDGSKLIDAHKVCACFTAAMLKVRIFDYDETLPKNLPIFYSNYTLAFLTGIHILYLCLLSDYEHDEKTEHFDELKKQATFLFPETNKGHDRYLQGRVKTLALNDLYDIDFDILTYADMLYWIEKYNKHKIAEKVLQKNNS